jgi:hypothetical protein
MSEQKPGVLGDTSTSDLFRIVHQLISSLTGQCVRVSDAVGQSI